MKKLPTVLVTVFVMAALTAYGQQASSCYDKATSQAGMAKCASDDAAHSDAELNNAYRALLAKAKANPGAVSKVRAAQRAWIAFRDAQLAAEAVTDGSSAPMCRSQLLKKLTDERTAQLRDMLNAKEGDVCAFQP